MTFKSHPDYVEILAAMKSLLADAKPMASVWYRRVETSFAHAIASGEGARLHGGRWNPLGSFRAVYLGDRPETAMQEYLARARRMKWPDNKSLPMVKPKEIGRWLTTESEEFDGHSPADMIRCGETGRLWRSLFYLHTGAPD